MKFAPLDTFQGCGCCFGDAAVPVSPFWRLWMRLVSSRGLSSTEPCFVSAR